MRAVAPASPWFGLSKGSPFKVLVERFLEARIGFNDDRDLVVKGASAIAKSNVYKWREDDVRGVTWPDYGGSGVDADLRSLLGDPDAEVEWLVAVGMRRDDAAYDLAQQRAVSRHLFPSQKDFDWWRIEAGASIADRIRESAKDAFDRARAAPGTIIELVLPREHEIEVRVELVEGVDEWWFVVDRAIDRVESRIVDAILNYGAPDVLWCEEHESSRFPDWAAASKRAYFGIPRD